MHEYGCLSASCIYEIIFQILVCNSGLHDVSILLFMCNEMLKWRLLPHSPLYFPFISQSHPQHPAKPCHFHTGFLSTCVILSLPPPCHLPDIVLHPKQNWRPLKKDALNFSCHASQPVSLHTALKESVSPLNMTQICSYFLLHLHLKVLKWYKIFSYTLF